MENVNKGNKGNEDKNAAAGNDLGGMTREDLERELREARSRKDTVEGGATMRTEKTTETHSVQERSRVKGFLGNMGKTTVAISGVVAGTLLGVGGTVLYHKRTTRTAVGTTGGDNTHVTVDTNM